MPAPSKALSRKGDTEPAADLGREAVDEVSSQLRRILAGGLAVYLKTKNFQRLRDNDRESLTPEQMLGELRTDHRQTRAFPATRP